MNINVMLESIGSDDLFNPSEEYKALRDMVRSFSKDELDQNSELRDSSEEMDIGLFKKLGKELTLFGVTIPEKDGGLGLSPVATTIILEELSAYDPAFALSYLAHEVLFVNNFFLAVLMRKKSNSFRRL